MAREPNLERVTKDYWEVSHALNHPNGASMGCGDALRQLRSAETLRPEEWRLRELTHTIRYDIIEGNRKWREEQRVVGSASILRMKH